MTTTAKLQVLAERWAGAKAAEKANLQSYVIELCGALGVEHGVRELWTLDRDFARFP